MTPAKPQDIAASWVARLNRAGLHSAVKDLSPSAAFRQAASSNVLINTSWAGHACSAEFDFRREGSGLHGLTLTFEAHAEASIRRSVIVAFGQPSAFRTNTESPGQSLTAWMIGETEVTLATPGASPEVVLTVVYGGEVKDPGQHAPA